MSLIALIIPLIIAGLVLWVCSQLPLDATIQKIIRVVVIVVVVLWLAQVLLGGPLMDFRIGR